MCGWWGEGEGVLVLVLTKCTLGLRKAQQQVLCFSRCSLGCCPILGHLHFKMRFVMQDCLCIVSKLQLSCCSSVLLTGLVVCVRWIGPLR
jgi:hypothetical protein